MTPLLVSVALFAGAYLAFQNPIILNMALSFADLYGITPSHRTADFFSAISRAIDSRFNLPQNTGSGSVISPTQNQQPTQRKTQPKPKSSPPQGQRKRPKSAPKPTKPSNWRDRINR